MGAPDFFKAIKRYLLFWGLTLRASTTAHSLRPTADGLQPALRSRLGEEGPALRSRPGEEGSTACVYGFW